MRLKTIKLAGFKSFVDPTVITLPASLIGVVGPNGCGKSNIIDAVRWVLGETSAKNLRGSSMTDVIFSGSTGRKPVGKASVELIFDNTEGKAPGPYARYAEISVRREVSRDGLSDYFLNKTKCRRKDITDVFLGTGLGPRTYSIIEQGMVTRIIEGKPEDMRTFVEEAAGISRYKERRRDTSNRIRHTRENLERVEDIRGELDTQIKRLQRQSKSAARYKVLRQEERQVHAELLSLRWQELGSSVTTEDASLSKLDTELESRKAEQQTLETAMEGLRQQRTGATDQFNALQAEFYKLGAQVASVEQSIEHAREALQQRKLELDQAEQALGEANHHLEVDHSRLDDYTQRLDQCGPRLSQCEKTWQSAKTALVKFEQSKDEWQSAWEAFARLASQPVKEQEVQSARIQQLEHSIGRNRERHQRLRDEVEDLKNKLQDGGLDALKKRMDDSSQACQQQEIQIQQLEERIREARRSGEELGAETEELSGQLQTINARCSSLEELQAAAMEQHDSGLKEWLREHDLQKAPRLAAHLDVEPGWELAVERVLADVLGALCVTSLDDLVSDLEGLAGSNLCVLQQSQGLDRTPGDARLLLDVVHSDRADLRPLISGVYLAQDLDAAMAQRGSLKDGESIVTRSGVWVGRNWLSLYDQESAKAGILTREMELETLREQGVELKAALDGLRQRQTEGQEILEALEAERDNGRRELSELIQQRATLHSEYGGQEAAVSQMHARSEQIQRELTEFENEENREQGLLDSSKELLASARLEVSDFESRRQGLLLEKEKIVADLEQARQQEADARDAHHREELLREGLQTSLQSTRESITRLEAQVATLSGRRQELEQIVSQGDEPELELKQRLEELLKKRVVAEEKLTLARKRVADVEADLQVKEKQRTEFEHRIQETRELLEQARMARQELVVRRETLEEQIRADEYEPKKLLEEIDDSASEEAWQTRLEGLEKKINRIGPVNLVAIEEFKEQSERKNYLDKQYEDLTQALGMLEDAMRKIDRETRTRFKETFDQVNTNFQAFFPKLFGGGHAYMELTDDDLLTAGVLVMARPPGKRNTTIHLLSGGEKALTAVALMFAFFELNPAPFCLLDEVDAPLDDANVERYSATVRNLAQRSQMIFITHNKITMESAELLIGVTMAEPGVSRLVAVDMAQAVEMAAQ
ncbi:MAG: chromosome segregation protein SMC [Gammaproteobacteria bacterium]|nr:chromosome segregation protein SMC [Gammaproteobacteria bacterium]